MTVIRGNLVDIFKEQIYPASVEIKNGKIVEIIKEKGKHYPNFILPGFIDAHIHIESSMLAPSEFARIAVVHGTVATVSDPHEIANVLGMKGIDFMIANGNKTPFHFYFGASSCVPSTSFETNGAILGVKEIYSLLKRKDILYLSEVMNYPGVISGDKQVLAKISAAKKLGKRIDGHAPGIVGKDIEKYVSSGITTDHECYLYEEALQKIKLGMKIQIREGSAAKNFEALYPLIERYPDRCMFCSDDRHPDDLVKGHVNEIVKMAISKRLNIFKVLRCACINPIIHYGLGVGMLRVGDNADFIIVDNLTQLNILETYINGFLVAKQGRTRLKRINSSKPNNFQSKEKKEEDFKIHNTINVMEVVDGQLVDKKMTASTKNLFKHEVLIDPKSDILKIAVVNRYSNAKPAIAFAKNFGLRKGAIASSVAHDSHNIIAVGVNDKMICKAVNCIIKNKGGVCAVDEHYETVLPLPIAGLMSDMDFKSVAEKYSSITAIAKSYGSKLHAPFMTLSFMALPVIPQLKLTDKGLFDVDQFKFVNLFNI